MKKKPTKAEESAAHNSAKKTKPESADATFKKVTDKVFSERKELLHQLAR